MTNHLANQYQSMPTRELSCTFEMPYTRGTYFPIFRSLSYLINKAVVQRRLITL